MYRSIEEVQDDLGQFEGPFINIVDAAWAIFTDKHRDLRGDYIPLTQAVLVQNYMQIVSRTILGGVRGIVMPPPGAPWFFINVGNKYIIKPRLLYPNGSVATNSTVLGFAFEDQQSGQLSLPGMPDAVTHLHLGYLLNKTRSSYASVQLACPGGIGRAAWIWTLSVASESTGSISFPVRPPDGGQPLVRTKRPEVVTEEPSTEEKSEHGTDA